MKLTPRCQGRPGVPKGEREGRRFSDTHHWGGGTITGESEELIEKKTKRGGVLGGAEEKKAQDFGLGKKAGAPLAKDERGKKEGEDSV